MDSVEFGTRLIAKARQSVFDPKTKTGAFESAGPNTDGGGFVDQCQAEMGLTPGHSWCACAVCKWVRDAAMEAGVKVSTFRRSAKALGLLALNRALVVTDPQPGDVIVWDHTVDPSKPQGHVAILTDVVKVNGAVAGLAAVAGNTSADGTSRNGDRAAEHPVKYPDPRIAGFVRITPDAPPVA